MSYKHDKEKADRAISKLDSLIDYESIYADDEVEEQEFELIPIKYIIENPVNIKWTIKGVLENGGVNLLSGKYGSGKSFVAFSMAFCVAAGIDWYGHRTVKTPVIVLAGEGHSGIGDRFNALSLHHEVDCPENLYLSKVPARLSDRVNAAWVKKAVDKICQGDGLVIIDTLNRNFGAGDENSTKDMTAFIESIDDHFRNSGKTVLIIHHTGHSDATRGRGSSVLPGSCEGEFIVVNNDGIIEFSCKKQKNYKQAENLFFSMKEVDLERLDEDEEPVTSLVIVKSTSEMMAENSLEPRDLEYFDRLYTCIHQYGVPIADENSIGITYQSITDAQAKKVAAEMLGEMTENGLRSAYRRMRDRLHDAGKIRRNRGYMSLIL